MSLNDDSKEEQLQNLKHEEQIKEIAYKAQKKKPAGRVVRYGSKLLKMIESK